MKYWMAVLCMALVACGGDDSDSGEPTAHPDREPEFYVDAQDLEAAENEAQRLCLLSSLIVIERGLECSPESVNTSDRERLAAECLQMEMPVPEILKQREPCLVGWAQNSCSELRGPIGAPCALLPEE